jgi:hypothetical protein
MYVTTIGKDYNVISLSLADKVDSPGERIVTSINFYKGDSRYVAKIGDDSIKLFNRDTKVELAEFNTKSKKVMWYLKHCCDLERSESNSVVVCPGCNDPILQDNFRNSGMLSFYGIDYSKKLSKALSESIPEFLQKFYDFCRSSSAEPSKPL